jgi:hypothetical protein
MDQFFTTNPTSLSVMSKCFSNDLIELTSGSGGDDYYPQSRVKQTTPATATPLMPNQEAWEYTDVPTEIEIDSNNKYEFAVETSQSGSLRELNVTEGSTLELTCKMNKLNTAQNLNLNFQRLKMNLFFKSQLRWFMNDTQLEITGDGRRAKKSFVQIVENKKKDPNGDFVLESKLIVANIERAKYTLGRVFCSASLYVDTARNFTRLKTSSVKVRVCAIGDKICSDDFQATGKTFLQSDF